MDPSAALGVNSPAKRGENTGFRSVLEITERLFSVRYPSSQPLPGLGVCEKQLASAAHGCANGENDMDVVVFAPVFCDLKKSTEGLFQRLLNFRDYPKHPEARGGGLCRMPRTRPVGRYQTVSM